MAKESHLRRWKWTALILGAAWLSIGCTPATISYFFVPSTVPPVCKLAKKKEVTVCVVTSFTSLETRTEAIEADRELADAFAVQLRRRAKENKEKIQIVSPEKVRAYQMQNLENVSLQDIGKHFKADYVIALEVNNLSLYERGSSQQLYRGITDLTIKVVDVAKPEDEGVIYTEPYQREYPQNAPRAASDLSIGQFRAIFLNTVATELVRRFTAYPIESRHTMD
jgi:hypothetical protein